MQSKIAIIFALFSAIAYAQSDDFNIDIALETKVLGEIESFITTLRTNPAFQTDVAALITALPNSVVQQAEQDPNALIDEAGDGHKAPSWVSAIPTPIAESLETLIAKPVKAVGDVDNYVEQLVEEPKIASGVSFLAAAVPTSVQQAFKSDPVGFLENIVTATALPSWVTDIPAPLQSEIGAIVNEALSIIDKDLGGGANATGTSGGFMPSSGYAKVTGAGGVVGYNGTTRGPSGTPMAFVGAAAPMKTVAAGIAALVVGAGVVFNV